MFNLQPVDSLEILLKEALTSQAQRRTAALKSSPKVILPAKPDIREIFANPANWREGRCIAIIHRTREGEQTLIGAFTEFRHKSHEARKLIRLDGPNAVSGEEYVTGDYWLRETHQLADANLREADVQPIVDREIIFDLMLEAIQVHASDVALVVRLVHGGISEVRLKFSTQFACAKSRVFIHLPKRLDILDAMSFENKVLLKKRLGIGA